jgi:hypothetical protein
MAELPRPNDDKNGYLNIWISKGYMESGKFRAAAGLAGLNFKIEEPEVFSFASTQIQAGDFMIEVMTCLCQYLISTGRISGTVIINEYEV